MVDGRFPTQWADDTCSVGMKLQREEINKHNQKERKKRKKM